MLSSNPPNTDSSPAPRIRKYTPRHPHWPYSPRDFTRSDESTDKDFYIQPRYVAHIDDQAITRLTAYFDSVLPRKGRVLDFCTSWNSWYPDDVGEAVGRKGLEVFGLGMSKPELGRNVLLKNHPRRSIVADLNENPDIRSHLSQVTDKEKEPPRFDSATCTVSIDYLTDPVAVLRSLKECMAENGSVHLAISDRCFPTKAVRIWLELDAEERLQLVGDYLHFAGWRDVEIVDLCARDEEGNGRGLQGGGLLGFLGGRHLDPLWVVRARR